VSMASQPSPRDVIERFYAAEAAYMNAGGADAGASFAGLAATLGPDVVLHQSPDLPWGGTFHGHAGYEDWARQMSRAFDRLEVKDARFFEDGDTVVITCRLVTRSRASSETLDLPMAQVVRVRGDRIAEFRPFYWNVPAYREIVRSA
jgi:ketosteroid isomerase-like protein